MSAALDSRPLPARDRILDAAERQFAQDGFAGASMKVIATDAGVAQGLLHYHFDTKDGLYAAVIARRSGIINDARHALLDQVDCKAPDALPRIFDALLRPVIEPTGGGRAYARILAGLAVADARDMSLVAEHYDPTAKRFLSALSVARPHAPPDRIAWGYSLAIGALLAAVARDGRPARLAGTPDDTEDCEALIARLVTYATGGMEALLADI